MRKIDVIVNDKKVGILVLAGILILVSAFQINTADAAPLEADASFGYSNVVDSAANQVSGDQSGTVRTFQSFNFSKDGLSKTHSFFKNLSAFGGVTITQADYTGVNLTQSDGSSRPLTMDKSLEFSSSLGVTYYMSGMNFGLSWAGNLNDSPYSYQSFGAKAQFQFFENTTVLEVSGDYTKGTQPFEYFTDSSFQTKTRPTALNTHAITTSLEQVVSDRYKVRGMVATSQRVEERPRNFAFTFGNRYALLDDLYLGMDLYHLMELESEALKTETGYYKIYSGTLLASYELTYDLRVSFSYSLAIETEEDPRRSYFSKQGSDQFGFGAKYKTSFGGIYAQGSYLVTKILTNQLNLTGGITWEL